MLVVVVAVVLVGVVVEVVVLPHVDISVIYLEPHFAIVMFYPVFYFDPYSCLDNHARRNLVSWRD